jgi:hypothetical protein
MLDPERIAVAKSVIGMIWACDDARELLGPGVFSCGGIMETGFHGFLPCILHKDELFSLDREVGA